MGQCTGVTNINLLWKNKNAPNYFRTLEGASSFISLLPWSLNLLQSLREKWIQSWITKVLEENVRAAARLVNATRQRWTKAHKPRKKENVVKPEGGWSEEEFLEMLMNWNSFRGRNCAKYACATGNSWQRLLSEVLHAIMFKRFTYFL